MKTLGGASFIYNGVSQDYSFIEALESLYSACDEIAFMYGGNDGTIEAIVNWIVSKNDEKKITALLLTESEWKSQQGREKLSYFSNKAIEALSTDFVLYIQGDECIHESSIPYVRDIINQDAESYLCKRINLWGCPYTSLEVEQNKKPVSTEIIRLAKRQYRCVDDAESIGTVPSCDIAHVDHIRIYHTGFVRDPHKHLIKIQHIQRDVFLMDYDKRVHDCEDGFDCWKFGFLPTDIFPIQERLPKFIKQWAAERKVEVFKGTEHGLEMAKMFLDHINYKEDFSIFRYPQIAIIDAANRLIYQVSEMYQQKNPD